MSQRRLDTYSLSQWHFLMLHAAGPITCVPRLLLYFQQVSVLKLSGGPLNVCSDNSEGLPLIFHLPLPPPVRCPFQSLIYGPHKCARDAEISEEVINRTRTKKRGGTRKQTEEVTGTCRVKAQVWQRKRGRFLAYYFSFTVEGRLTLLLCLLYTPPFWLPSFFLSCQLTFELLMVDRPPCGLFS